MSLFLWRRIREDEYQRSLRREWVEGVVIGAVTAFSAVLLVSLLWTVF